MDWYDDMDVDPPLEVLEKNHRLERAHLAKEENNFFLVFMYSMM